MQVFVKFSVGLDAVELLKQIDELGESRFTLLFTSHIGNVKTLFHMRTSFHFLLYLVSSQFFKEK